MFPRISIVIFIEINRSLISCILHKNVMKTVNLSILLWVNVGYILLCFDVLLFTVNFEKVSWCILVYIWNAIKIWSLYLQYWCPRYPFRLFTLNIHQVAHLCLYKIFNSTFYEIYCHTITTKLLYRLTKLFCVDVYSTNNISL